MSLGYELLYGGIMLAVLMFLFWLFALLTRGRNRQGTFRRLELPGLFVFFGATYIWYAGNIKYGNQAALFYLLDLAEEMNGEASLQPWVRSTAFILTVNLLPSAGQWWRWQFKPKGKHLYASYVLSGIDVGLNAVGLYLGFAPFQLPPNIYVFMTLLIAAYIPNIWAQEIAQDAGRLILNTWLFVPTSKEHKKEKKKKNTTQPKGATT